MPVNNDIGRLSLENARKRFRMQQELAERAINRIIDKHNRLFLDKHTNSIAIIMK